MISSVPAPKKKKQPARHSPAKPARSSAAAKQKQNSAAVPAGEETSASKAPTPGAVERNRTQNDLAGRKSSSQMEKKKKKLKKPALMDMSTEGNLAVEAHHLRIILREISGRFLSDLESEIVRIVGMISQVSDKEKKQAELRSILKQMQSLRLRPDRGKLGDLRRIRNLVERITARLEEII